MAKKSKKKSGAKKKTAKKSAKKPAKNAGFFSSMKSMFGGK